MPVYSLRRKRSRPTEIITSFTGHKYHSNREIEPVLLPGKIWIMVSPSGSQVSPIATSEITVRLNACASWTNLIIEFRYSTYSTWPLHYASSCQSFPFFHQSARKLIAHFPYTSKTAANDVAAPYSSVSLIPRVQGCDRLFLVFQEVDVLASSQLRWSYRKALNGRCMLHEMFQQKEKRVMIAYRWWFFLSLCKGSVLKPKKSSERESRALNNTWGLPWSNCN